MQLLVRGDLSDVLRGNVRYYLLVRDGQRRGYMLPWVSLREGETSMQQAVTRRLRELFGAWSASVIPLMSTTSPTVSRNLVIVAVPQRMAKEMEVVAPLTHGLVKLATPDDVKHGIVSDGEGIETRTRILLLARERRANRTPARRRTGTSTQRAA